MLSYNEEHARQIKLRHIFFPSAYGLVFETILAISALVVFNTGRFSDQISGRNFGVTGPDPLSIWFSPIQHLLNVAGQYHIVQQILLFGLWAATGALVYILVFRTLQMAFSVRQSVGDGVRFMRVDSSRGLFRWLYSLHDFFVGVLTVLLGIVAMAMGALVCFGIASQEFSDGLAASFPANIWPLAVSLVAALLSVRVIGLGVSLLSPRFRNWYNT